MINQSKEGTILSQPIDRRERDTNKRTSKDHGGEEVGEEGNGLCHPKLIIVDSSSNHKCQYTQIVQRLFSQSQIIIKRRGKERTLLSKFIV